MDNLSFQKKEQELNRLKRTIQRDTQKKRRQRTHHLIQKGAMLESYFDMKELTVEETEKVLKKLAPIIKKIREKNH